MPEWFADGLQFTCTRCSNCCRHESGYVFLSQQDLTRLAAFFRMTEDEFSETYCKTVDLGITRRLSLREQDNFDCVFFREGRCSVYPARPLQCRAYPFWPQIADSRESWNEETKHCPGINIGPRKSHQTVREWLDARASQQFLEG